MVTRVRTKTNRQCSRRSRKPIRRNDGSDILLPKHKHIEKGKLLMAAGMGKPKKEKADKSVVADMQNLQAKTSRNPSHLLVAEDKSAGRSRSWRSPKTKAFYIFAGIVLVTVLVLTVYLKLVKEQSELSAPTDTPERDLTQIVNNDSVKDVVRQYGAEYDTATEELKTKSTEWDKARLDKAYFSLLYAHKVGAFNQVYTMLSLIDAAQRNGLNIDDNSYGISQDERDAIRKRADVHAQKVRDRHQRGGNE